MVELGAMSTPIDPTSLQATTSPTGEPQLVAPNLGASHESVSPVGKFGVETIGTSPLETAHYKVEQGDVTGPTGGQGAAEDEVVGPSAGGVGHVGEKDLSASQPSSGTKTTTSASTDSTTPAASTKGASASPSDTISAAATGLRQRMNTLSKSLDQASDHPSVKQFKGAAQTQTQRLREALGSNELVLDAEKRTGVDRVVLVLGGAAAYMLLIPLNLFGLALPTTNLLTYVPPTYVALELLEKPHTTGNDARVKILLSYFVTLGFVQFLESLAAGVLARRIPQYYTLKLLFLAFLLHPKTQGAVHLQDRFFSRLVRPSKVGAVNTPPTSHSGVDSVNSSPKYPAAPTSATSAGDSPVFPSPSHASTGATGGSVTLPSGPGTGQGMEVPL